MDFDISATGRTAKGNINVLYNNLKITMLKADTANDRLKHMTIASMFANLMVLKHDNPDDDGEKPRTAYVSYFRPDTVSFFGSIWQTLLAGIKPSAGFNTKMQQNVKAEIADHKQKKEERLVKKAQRKQRRAERKRKRELKKELKEQQKTASA
jgi:hypothetical protein